LKKLLLYIQKGESIKPLNITSRFGHSKPERAK
jgi:hypothetical protein